MIDNSEIVSRLRQACKLSSDKELAGKLGLSQQDFSIRKKRGTLITLIIDFAINYKVDLNWLLTGKGGMFAGETAEYSSKQQMKDAEQSENTSQVARNESQAMTDTHGFKISDALTMAARVLDSGTSYANALYLNIQHFDRAIQAETRLSAMENELSHLKKEVAGLTMLVNELAGEKNPDRKPINQDLKKEGTNPDSDLQKSSSLPATKSNAI